MWVIDIRHWLDETQSGPAVPQLRLKVKKLGEIIISDAGEGLRENRARGFPLTPSGLRPQDR